MQWTHLDFPALRGCCPAYVACILSMCSPDGLFSAMVASHLLCLVGCTPATWTAPLTPHLLLHDLLTNKENGVQKRKLQECEHCIQQALQSHTLPHVPIMIPKSKYQNNKLSVVGGCWLFCTHVFFMAPSTPHALLHSLRHTSSHKWVFVVTGSGYPPTPPRARGGTKKVPPFPTDRKWGHVNHSYHTCLKTNSCLILSLLLTRTHPPKLHEVLVHMTTQVISTSLLRHKYTSTHLTNISNM